MKLTRGCQVNGISKENKIISDAKVCILQMQKKEDKRDQHQIMIIFIFSRMFFPFPKYKPKWQV